MTKTFSVKWKVDGVNWQKDFSTRINVKKPVLFLNYVGSLSGVEVPLAFVSGKEISPSDTIGLVDLSSSVLENRIAATSVVKEWNTSLFSLSSKSFDLTDVVASFVAPAAVPLFYKHTLPESSIDPDSVRILDKDMNEVPLYSYTVERISARDSSDLVIDGSYEGCYVYHNYKNYYLEDEGEFDFYFVRYVVSGEYHYQVLASDPMFVEATVDDVSSVTGLLKPWRKVYTISSGMEGYEIQTSRGSDRYYTRGNYLSQLSLLLPTERRDEDPWFMELTRGSFVRVVDDERYFYSIPEFSSQNFYPIEPYKLVNQEEGVRIRGDLIWVARNPLHIDTSLTPCDVVVRDSYGKALYALTTDVSRSGNFYLENGEKVLRDLETEPSWIVWEYGVITSWDSAGGFIHLSRTFGRDYGFEVTYYYTAKTFTVSSVNVNPTFADLEAGEFYVLYVVPNGGWNGWSITEAVQYLIVDRSGRVRYSSQDSSGGGLDLQTLAGSGTSMMPYSRHITTTNSAKIFIGDTSITIDNGDLFPESGEVVWTSPSTGEKEWARFNRSGNVLNLALYVFSESIGIGYTFRFFDFMDEFMTAGDNEYQFLVLGEIRVRTATSPEDLTVIDLREEGGVIRDSWKEKALELDPRALWATKGFLPGVGQPVPGETAVTVKVPFTLLTDYGGDFTFAEIEGIVKDRHLAVGVVPIILLDGPIPTISGISSSDTEITVTWYSEGSGYTYNVYYGPTKDGSWTQANATAIADVSSGNSFTISSLTPETIYYVVVTSTDSASVESPKSKPWGIKTRAS